MKKEYQVTLLCTTRKYKPMSCLVPWEQDDDIDHTTIDADKQEIIRRGIEKMCIKHSWRKQDLSKYGYTKVKVRIYDRILTPKADAERYEKIKQEKYASGEWRAPQ